MKQKNIFKNSMEKCLIMFICLASAKFTLYHKQDMGGQLTYASVGLTHMVVTIQNDSTDEYDCYLYNMGNNQSIYIISSASSYAVSSFTNSTTSEYWITIYTEFAFKQITPNDSVLSRSEQSIHYVEYGEGSEDRYFCVGSKIQYNTSEGGTYSYQINGICHEILYQSSMVYVLVEDGSIAYLYEFNKLLSLIRVHSAAFSVMSSFCVGSQGVVHATDNSISIYQADNLTHQAIFPSLSVISSISWIGEELVINGMGLMLQYNIQRESIVDSFQNSIAVHSSLENSTVLGWSLPSTLVLLEVTTTIVCVGGCSSCPASYQMNVQLECEYSPVVDNGTVNDSTTGNQSSGEEKYPDLKKVMTLTGTILIASSWRVSLKFIVPFLWMLEEAWFYQFHQTKYPQFMQYFMYNVDLLNFYRLKPSCLDLDKVHISVMNDEKYNQLYYQYGEQQEPKNVYFLHSSKDFYIWNIAMNIAIFLALQLLSLIFRFLAWVFSLRLFKIIHTEIKMRLKWWIFLLNLLESNSIFLVFSITSQFMQPYSFDIYNKINLIIASMVGFVIFICTIVFFPLVYRYCRQNLAQQILTFSNHSFGSFYLEMFLVLWRNFFKGFIHRLFYQNYQVQIQALIGVDIFLLLSVIYFKKNFHNLITFIVYLFYALVFTLFNITLYLRYKEVNLPLSYDLVIEVEILIILGLMLLKMLLCIFQMFKGIHEVCRTNRIHPDSKSFEGVEKSNGEFKRKESKQLEEVNDIVMQKQKTKEKIEKALEAESIKTEQIREWINRKPAQIILCERQGEERIKKLPRPKKKEKFMKKKENINKKQEEVLK